MSAPHWPFATLTPMQQRWVQQQQRAMQDGRSGRWPLGLPPQQARGRQS